MGASLSPHWGIIIFLVIAYAISALMHLDPNILHPGLGIVGAMAVTVPDIVVLIGELALGLTIGVLVGSYFGRWLGIATGACVTFLATVFLNTWMIFIALFSIATFSDLGLPDVVQWALAVPCVLLTIWTLLSFIVAGTETFNGIVRPPS